MRIPQYRSTESTDQGGDQAIPLADGSGIDEPGATLAVAGADGVNDALPLHVHHHGVNGALVAAGIHAHGANQVAACHGALLNQDAADGGAGESGEVHWGGVVN